MKSTVYYMGRNGEHYNRRQMETAFYLATGISAREHEGKFLAWLKGRYGFGHPIAYYFAPTVEDLVYIGEIVEAMKMYREEHNCSLSEAYEYTKKIQNDMHKKGKF